MKKLTFAIVALLVLAAGRVRAQEDISGTWSGMLPIGPDATLEIHFVLTREADGAYSAILTSPDQGGVQDTPASSTSFDGERLTLTVDALSGRYEGTLANGSFSGSWFQQGTEIPLALTPFVERALSDADKAAIRGSWVGELSMQGITLAIVFRFEDNDAGEFVGFLDSPDQGARGIALAGIELADGTLEFDIPQAGASYTAAVGADSLTGTFTQLGRPAELNMTRGEYLARGLDVSPEAIERLEGSWVGEAQNPAGSTVPIVFRFVTSDGGRLAAYLDSPNQGVTDIPISEVELNGDALSLVVPAAQASFTATLSADEMTGTWAQGNRSQPVTMTRGEYSPPVAALDLPDAAMQQLAGAWRGSMGPLELILRFETTADGNKLAQLDVPAQGVSGLAVPEVALDGDQLSFALPALGATFTGTLAGNEVQGTWVQGPNSNPLTLTRDP